MSTIPIEFINKRSAKIAKTIEHLRVQYSAKAISRKREGRDRIMKASRLIVTTLTLTALTVGARAQTSAIKPDVKKKHATVAPNTPAQPAATARPVVSSYSAPAAAVPQAQPQQNAAPLSLGEYARRLREKKQHQQQ